MAIIYSYPDNENLLLTDMLIGTSTIRINGRKKNITKNFTLESLGMFISENFPTTEIVWGNITGNLSNQTDLQDALDAKQANITLTTTGTSGLATFIGSTLNIPDYGSGYVTPTLQSVTDEGNITTTTVYLNGAAVSESINEQAIFQPDSISTANLNSGSGVTLDSTGKVGLSPDGVSYSTFAADNITQSITLQAPNKAAGTYTLATTDDTTLQGVVDNGNTVGNILSFYSELKAGEFFVAQGTAGTKTRITSDGYIYFTNGSGSITSLSNTFVSNNNDFIFPNKPSGSAYTLATTADIPAAQLVALPFTTDHLTATNNAYVIGDIVWYLGNVYRCIANNDSILPTATSYWTNLGAGYPLVQQPTDWDSTSGNNQILNKPTIPVVTGYVPYTGANQNVNLGEYELKAGQLSLDVSPTGTAAVGTTRWNDSIGSSETTLKGGTVILKNGIDLVARVVNKVTPNATLTKAAYQAVRVSGAQGQRLAVAYAQANNDNNSADTIGLVCETIPTNQEGFIITVGQLEDINTTGSLQGETWADGDVLYLSPTTAGRLTNIKPTGLTGHIVVMGYVEYAHAIHGKIYVKIMNGWELDELHNVYINPATIANNDGLFYDSSDQLWKNETIASALGYTPENITDKQNSLALDGTAVKYPTVDAVNNLSFIDKFKRGIQYFTDFDNTASTTPNFAVFVSGAGADTRRTAGNIPNQSANQIGFSQFQTGTTTAGYATMINEGFVGKQFVFGGGDWVFETFINVETLSNATNRFRFMAGFGDSPTNASEGNGVLFTYDEGGTQNGTIASPNWQCVTSVGSVRTLTTTATAVSANTWTKLRIEVNAAGTSVTFYINGTLVATHTTNIPTFISATNNRGFNVKQSILKSIGTTNRSVFCDYLGYENRLTTIR